MTTIGVTFGCYCPLHQGHMNLIMKAKRENDLSFVFVCGTSDPRYMERDAIIPLQKRYRLIKNFLDDDTLFVDKIDDADLGLDESMSNSNWQTWVHAVEARIYSRLSSFDDIKVKWYVGEKTYVTPIVNYAEFPTEVEVVNRVILPISGTELRRNPIPNWHYIMSPFRPYLTHTILIAGTASEGKSTLTRDLGKYFNLPFSYEKGRDICKLKTDPEFNVQDFIYNIYEQRKLNEELICSCGNNGIVLSDTDNIVSLMYANAYAQRSDFALNAADYKVLEELVNAYAPVTKWNKIFLLEPSPRGIIDDGERYMPDSDYNVRRQFHEFLVNTYQHYGYKVEILPHTMNYYEKFDHIRAYIEKVMRGEAK